MKHLKSVDENYFKHIFEAWFISLITISAGLICFIHGLFPFLFQHTASDMIKYIINRVEQRNNYNE